MSSVDHLIPDSVLLPPHLAAHKYLFVCTLTVAAWDSLVLSARTWKMMKTPEWSALKVLLLVMRYLMPIEFIAVGVAFFDASFSLESCQRFYLFEPIMTAIMLALASTALVIRVSAIYEKNRAVMASLGALLLIQLGVQTACCFFYRVVPLKATQGCIAGPKHNWVGVYWLAPTLLYFTCFTLAVNRSLVSLQTRQITWWNLILRDGLNLYGAVFGVNLVNVVFWFVAKPSNTSDSIKTICTSMATVLTTTMTMRVILLVRGSLLQGGSFFGPASPSSSSTSKTRHSHARSGSTAINRAATAGIVDVSRSSAPTFSITTDGALDMDDQKARESSDRDVWPPHSGVKREKSSNSLDEMTFAAPEPHPYQYNPTPLGPTVPAPPRRMTSWEDDRAEQPTGVRVDTVVQRRYV